MQIPPESERLAHAARFYASSVPASRPMSMPKATAKSFGVLEGRQVEWSPSGTSPGKALGDHAPRRAPLFIGENPSKEPSNPRFSSSPASTRRFEPPPNPREGPLK